MLIKQCVQAYHRGLQFPRYLFVTIGWYSNFWWREDEQNLSCTIEERENVLGHSLVVSDEIFLDAERDANVMTTPGIVSVYSFKPQASVSMILVTMPKS